MVGVKGAEGSAPYAGFSPLMLMKKCSFMHNILIIIAFITMLTNATSEQQAATQDSNCIIEHKALARRPQVQPNITQ